MFRLFKYFGSILLLIIVIALAGAYVWKGNKTAKSKEDTQKQTQPVITSEQYKMYFSFEGDQSQIIDLMKGQAKFSIVYTGDSKFTARILNTDGTVLAVLADINGPYNQKQNIDVPETGPYLLDVKTSGEWSLARE